MVTSAWLRLEPTSSTAPESRLEELELPLDPWNPTLCLESPPKCNTGLPVHQVIIDGHTLSNELETQGHEEKH